MFQYRKKPVVIEAMHLTRDEGRQDDIINWAEGNNTTINALPSGSLVIPTLEGDMIANFGDYIIKGVKGEFYPCKADIFEATYDLVLPSDE